ncbi:MAG: hypothetical protein WDN10_03430 [bacterium]
MHKIVASFCADGREILTPEVRKEARTIGRALKKRAPLTGYMVVATGKGIRTFSVLHVPNINRLSLEGGGRVSVWWRSSRNDADTMFKQLLGLPEVSCWVLTL